MNKIYKILAEYIKIDLELSLLSERTAGQFAEIIIYAAQSNKDEKDFDSDEFLERCGLN